MFPVCSPLPTSLAAAEKAAEDAFTAIDNTPFLNNDTRAYRAAEAHWADLEEWRDLLDEQIEAGNIRDSAEVTEYRCTSCGSVLEFWEGDWCDSCVETLRPASDETNPYRCLCGGPLEGGDGELCESCYAMQRNAADEPEFQAGWKEYAVDRMNRWQALADVYPVGEHGRDECLESAAFWRQQAGL